MYPDICNYFKEEVISLFISQITIFCYFTLSWVVWRVLRFVGERKDRATWDRRWPSAAAAAFAKSFMALAKAAAIAAFFLAFTVNDVQQREARIFVRASCDLFETVLRQLIATTERNSVRPRKQDSLEVIFLSHNLFNRSNNQSWNYETWFLYLVLLMKRPILQIQNFNFPNLRCCKVVFFLFDIVSYIGIFGCILMLI